MANQPTLTALFLISNSTDFVHNNNSDTDVVSHRYVIEWFRLAFVVLGIVIGVIAIGLNTAIIISSLIKTSYLTATFSSQTLNLMISLAVADLFLLVFGMEIKKITNFRSRNSIFSNEFDSHYFLSCSGLPYDLVAANDNPWLEGRIGCQMSAYLPEA